MLSSHLLAHWTGSHRRRHHRALGCSGDVSTATTPVESHQHLHWHYPCGYAGHLRHNSDLPVLAGVPSCVLAPVEAERSSAGRKPWRLRTVPR